MYCHCKVFVVALLLNLAAADPTPEGCVQTDSAEEMNKIFGKWILHEAYILNNQDETLLKSTNSSQSEFILSEDNQTVTFKQAFTRDKICTRYAVNLTVVENTIQDITTGNTTSKVEFLKTCNDCLTLRYSTNRRGGRLETYLLFYTKTKVLLQTDQEKVREHAKCLGFQHPPVFIYKEAEFCPELTDATEEREPQQ